MSHRILSRAILAASLAGAWELSSHDQRAIHSHTRRKRGDYDTNALRDDDQRIKEAQARRERKRMKRLQQAKREKPNE